MKDLSTAGECCLCGVSSMLRPWAGFPALCGRCEERCPLLPWDEPLDPQPITPPPRRLCYPDPAAGRYPAARGR